MGLVLTVPPGYSDLQDVVLAANKPAFGIHIAKIYSNAAFGKVRIEVFQQHYKHGDTIPLPVSPIDGYPYSRNELRYMWAVESTADLASGWMTGKDSLWYCDWLVDQSTGAVTCDEWYRRSGSHSNPVHTNDGVLRVFTIAQRQLTMLVMATSPSYSGISGAWIAQDKPLTQQLAQGMNDDAKFSVVNREVFYLGEYYNGQTVTMPISPADGYHYSAAECQFHFSWRWTTQGNASQIIQPLESNGQMATMKASVNSSGVVSCSVAMVDDAGVLFTSTIYGRIAVFAFCTRSGTPSGASPALSFPGFAEIDYNAFMPGSDLPYDSVVQTIVSDIDEALATPEFFGPTTYKDGDTIPRPFSLIDPSYQYTRNELHYIYEISDTTNQTGSHLRVPIWYTDINTATGFVKVNVWRLPPGGPTIDDNNTLGRISVTVVAWRQAQAPTAITPGTANQSQSSSSGVGTQDVPTVSTIAVLPAIGSINSSNQSFTFGATGTIVAISWNGQVRTDFTQTSPPSNSFSTTFTPDTGDTVEVLYVA